MNNTEKLLRAFIKASGFDIKSEPVEHQCSCAVYTNQGCQRCDFKGFTSTTDYKVTKRPKTKEEVVKDMCKELFEFAKEADTKLVSFISPVIKVTLNKESGELEVEDNENI